MYDTERNQAGSPLPASKKETITHSLVAVNRHDITVQGVRDVLRFDEEAVVLLTVQGQLILEGRDLRVHVLNTQDGLVRVEGTLDGVLYDDLPDPHESAPAAPAKRTRRPRFFG